MKHFYLVKKGSLIIEKQLRRSQPPISSKSKQRLLNSFKDSFPIKIAIVEGPAIICEGYCFSDPYADQFYEYSLRCQSPKVTVYAVSIRMTTCLPENIQTELRDLAMKKAHQRKLQYGKLERLLLNPATKRISQSLAAKPNISVDTSELEEMGLKFKNEIRATTEAVKQMQAMLKHRNAKLGDQKDPLGEFFHSKTRGTSRPTNRSFEIKRRSPAYSRIDQFSKALNHSRIQTESTISDKSHFFIKKMRMILS